MPPLPGTRPPPPLPTDMASKGRHSVAGHGPSPPLPISPSKRSAHHPSSPVNAFNSRPLPTHRSTAPPANPPTTHTPTDSVSGLPAPRYNLIDEDSLPSPFIKKKTSAPPSAVAAAAIQRRPSSLSVAFGTVVQPARAAPSRPLHPSTSRQSLANRLAMNRASKMMNSVIDEQGRVPMDRRSSTIAATMS